MDFPLLHLLHIKLLQKNFEKLLKSESNYKRHADKKKNPHNFFDSINPEGGVVQFDR